MQSDQKVVYSQVEIDSYSEHEEEFGDKGDPDDDQGDPDQGDPDDDDEDDDSNDSGDMQIFV